jgi:hypothetical protein
MMQVAEVVALEALENVPIPKTVYLEQGEAVLAYYRFFYK